MKTKKYRQILLNLFLTIFLISCSDETQLNVPIQQNTYTPNDGTPLGEKLEYMRNTYDVAIYYKWDRSVFATDAVADPASGTDVLPYVELMEEIFFKAIDNVQEKEFDFARKETPVNYFLIGSGINYGGTKAFGESTVGQAGNIQPNRLTLGGVSEYANLLRDKNSSDSKISDNDFIDGCINNSKFGFPGEGGLAGFLYHEFTHYIDAKNSIPKGFQEPAFNNYLRGTNAYQQVSFKEAREKGFMLPYGMQNEHEDFATYVQVMISYPKATVDSYLLSDATKAKAKLVYDYYLLRGLDLYKLHNYLHSDEMKTKLLEIKRKYEK